MRAVILEDFGTLEFGDVPVPEVSEDGVLVRVRASSLNPSDWKLADGKLRGPQDYDFPMRMGRDFAGVVESAGSAVTLFAPGDEVFGMTHAIGRSGAFAEFLAIPERACIARKPPALTFEQAAALPVAGLTALQAAEFVAAGEGERVLVVGAPGGLGTYALQLVRRRGAVLIATGLPDDEEYVRSYGAVDVLDYRHGTAALVRERYPEGLDHLIDLATVSDEFRQIAALVQPGGRAVSALQQAKAENLPAHVTGLNLGTPQDAQLLLGLGGLVASGELHVPIERVLLFEEAIDGLLALRDAHSRGKHAVSIG